MKFIPSLELSRMLYKEEVAPLIADTYPKLKYAAATYGMCSESLGLDDEVSRDHMWGPRVTIFLSEEDHDRYTTDLMMAIRASLPTSFKGLPMTWKKPGVDIQDTSEEALYTIRTTTVSDALGFCGGADALPLQDVDWLKVSEQHLLEFTSGVVYRDDSGELTEARTALEHYPDNVLRFLLSQEWSAVGGDWFPIGRIGSRGDELGLGIQAAKIARRLMSIAFLVSRSYAPYKKWLGTLFQDLPVATRLEPVLKRLLNEENWQRVEEHIGEAAYILLERQNRLRLTPNLRLKAEKARDGRHHLNYGFWEIGQRLARDLPPSLKSLLNNQVFWLDERSLILWNDEVGKWPLLLQK